MLEVITMQPPLLIAEEVAAARADTSKSLLLIPLIRTPTQWALAALAALAALMGQMVNRQPSMGLLTLLVEGVEVSRFLMVA